MAETLGIALKAGWQREALVTATAWPAASAAVLTALLPLLDLQGNDGVEKASSRTVDSSRGPAGFDVVSRAPSATLALQCRYQGLEPLWACALGHMPRRIGVTLMPEQLATGVYRHLYEVDTRLSTAQSWQFGDGFRFGTELDFSQRKVRRGTLAGDVQVSVWEWLSSMIQSITLQAGLGGVTLTCEVVSYSLVRNSVVNTTTTIGKLPPNAAPRILFSDLAVRIGPYSTSIALGSGDAVKSTSWTLRLENNLGTSFGPHHGLAPEEYERSEPARATLTFQVPRHESDLWQTRWSNNAVLMAEAKFTSEREITSGQPYRLNVYLPSCQVTNAQLQTNGPAIPPDSVQLVGIMPTGQPAGMPTFHTRTPLAVEVVSGVSQHPLL